MSEQQKPIHTTLPYFKHDASELLVGGKRLSVLAQELATTPFYAYDRALITERIAKLRGVLPKDLSLHYAMKANPMPDVVRHIAPLVDGIDVASHREMQIAIANGAKPATISLAGPGKTDFELYEAVKAGIVINVESFRELEPLVAAGHALHTRPQINVRINPDFELKGSGMRMGGGAKQFGIDAEMIPQFLAQVRKLDLDFHGFHIFSGSNCLNANAIIEAQEKTFALAIRLAQTSGVALKTLNIGGGFGIPYFPGDQALDVDAIGAYLHDRLPRVQQELPGVHVMVELGRYIVGEAGIYVARVIDRKVSRGEVFLITDGGLHHHLAASGNFGQVIRKNYPVAIGNKMHSPDTETVSVVGPLCTPLDILADKMTLPRAEIGDLVVIFQSGAYGPSASPLNFLSHPAAREVLV